VNSLLCDKALLPSENALWSNNEKIEKFFKYAPLVLDELCLLKGYSDDTLFTAHSLNIRYIVSLLKQGLEPICLFQVAVTSVLLAVKLEEPKQPKFSNMAKLVRSEWKIDLLPKQMCILERDIIQELDFGLQTFATPPVFLDRFLRLFGLDSPHSREPQVSELATLYLKNTL
jgi:hypothetical protein